MADEKNIRLAYIDVARGIGITLVVLSHAEGLNPFILKWVHSFFIPLFFFISGVVISRKSLESSFIEYFKSNFKSIVIPYFFFGLITFIPWVLVFRYHETAPYVENEGIKQFIGLFYGIGRDWLRYNVPLWFLPCLFTTKIIFYWIFRLKKASLIAIFSVAAAICGHVLIKYLPFHLPWLIDVSMITVMFFSAGYLVRDKMPEFSGIKSLSTGLAFLAANIMLMSLNGARVDMNYGVSGNILIFYPAAFFGIFFTLYISMFIHDGNIIEKAFSRLGRESLVIFALNAVTFKLLTGAAIYILKLPSDFRDIYPVSIPVYVIITCIALFFVGKFLSKYLPWSVGGRK